MSSLVRISEDASLALHAMAMFARYKDRRLTNAEVAKALDASEHTLSKVLQRLTRARLARAVRGPAGGFALGRPATEISVLEIYEAVEGPILSTDCLLSQSVCSGKRCELGELVRSVRQDTRNYFALTTLADLAAGMESTTWMPKAGMLGN